MFLLLGLLYIGWWHTSLQPWKVHVLQGPARHTLSTFILKHYFGQGEEGTGKNKEASSSQGDEHNIESYDLPPMGAEYPIYPKNIKKEPRLKEYQLRRLEVSSNSVKGDFFSFLSHV